MLGRRLWVSDRKRGRVWFVTSAVVVLELELLDCCGPHLMADDRTSSTPPRYTAWYS